MKKLSVLIGFIGALFIGGAYAANITIYHSPSCPHCHHARDFISNNLIYEYPNLNVTLVNVMESENRDMFFAALEKCEYKSGGVPVLVIGEKCFQGYGDSMADSIRAAIEVDLSDQEKSVAVENRRALAADADAFKKLHADRIDAVVERNAGDINGDVQKKNNSIKTSNNTWVFYVILVVLVLGLGFVLTRGGNKK